MQFLLTRFIVALRQNRTWYWLTVLPPVAYLVAMAFLPSQYRISQAVRLAAETPLAATKSPIKGLTPRDLLADGGYLFLQEYALVDLKEALLSDTRYKDDAWLAMTTAQQFNSLRRIVGAGMSLSRAPGDQGLIVAYDGDNRQLGSALVAFYSQRVVDFAVNGKELAARFGSPGERKNPVAGQYPPPRSATNPRKMDSDTSAPPAALAGEQTVRPIRTYWDAYRLLPAISLCFMTALLVTLAIGIREFSDDKLKSERQAARHLQLEIWGVMPDIDGFRLQADLDGKPQAPPDG